MRCIFPTKRTSSASLYTEKHQMNAGSNSIYDTPVVLGNIFDNTNVGISLNYASGGKLIKKP